MALALDPMLFSLLQEVGRSAHDLSMRAWAVGGLVRDALRGLPSRDVDISVEGDAPALAEALQAAWGAEMEQHDAFTTAALKRADGYHVDIVQARSEVYAFPGALPSITPGTLDDDLRRRDFSVNAIALALDPNSFGTLVDPLGGRSDLERGILRTLHAGSFIDDPTRLFRAARYATRIELIPDEETNRTAEEAVACGALETISADRRRNEVELICGESGWAHALGWLNRWGVWTALASGFEAQASMLMRIDIARAWAARSVREALPPLPWLRFLALLAMAPEALAEALSAKPAEGELVRRAHAVGDTLDMPETGAWQRAMDAEAPETLLLALSMARTDGHKHRLTEYWRRVRPVRLTITGDDLVRAGVAPGPAIGEALRATLDAVRAGAVSGREEELAFALAAIAHEGNTG